VTISSWESVTNQKIPPVARIQAYARFFCTERSLQGEPHLLAENELTPEELKRLQEIESQLLDLSRPQDREVHRIFQFDEGPVVIICPDAPDEVRGSLANEHDPNFTKLQQYGDLDALLMLFGHLRAENPSLDVLHRLATEVVPDDYSRHVILLGGVAWNKATRRMQSALRQVPVKQIAVKDLKAGDVFRIESDHGRRFFYPEYEEFGDEKELAADVACIARLSNPFKPNRTVTICNGIHSRGVLGAVRCLTDPTVRKVNEKYLSTRFPSGEFAILLRVRVVKSEALAPDLTDPAMLLYAWNPDGGSELTEAGIAASRNVAQEDKASVPATLLAV
jgi:hypothetical protein